MNRTDLINFLLRHRGYKSYLEIGVYNEQHNFANIQCQRKVGVDVEPVTTFQGTPDDFFAQNQETFDIIFIDGVHTEQQVLKDIGNAIRSLATGGIIVIHDCLPPDEWHQRKYEDYKEGENWNGTVWKAVLKVFNYSKYHCSIIDTDWGCGLIDTSRNQKPLGLDLPGTLDYKRHFSLLTRYTISTADFVRDYVKVFYHLACMGNWKEVFKEQMRTLHQNGFQKLALTVLGANGDLKFVEDIGKSFNLEIDILFNDPALTHYEKPGMYAIQDYAKKEEGYVLYLHSKGVSQPHDQGKNKWRQLMMRELVGNWKNCVLQLPHFDIIGVNWRDLPPVSHFCGNFWYASTHYIRKLPDFEYYYEHPAYQIWDSHHNKRLSCEFWIGAAPNKPKLLSLKYRNVDFCNPSFWKYKR